MEDIRPILKRYYDGLATPDEEARLRRYFAGDDVPDDLAADQQLFRAMDQMAAPFDKGMEQRLSREIDRWSRVEATTIRRGRTVRLRWITGIAASLLVLTVTGVRMWQVHSDAQAAQPVALQEDTYKNEKDAYEATARALTKFSKSLNKGLQMTRDPQESSNGNDGDDDERD
jgi:hypothetical protein